MRLTRKKIEEIIRGILGPAGTELLGELYGVENVSEFDLAKKTKKDIKEVRKLLYLLHNENLVGFTRKKDKQKGWYVYYWTLLPENVKFGYYKQKKQLLVKLREQLEREEKELFFVAPNSTTRYTFDEAMEYEFHCPETGELLTQEDTEKRKVQLKKKIVQTEAALEAFRAKKKKQKVATKERKKVVRKKEKAKKAVKPKAKKVVKKAKKPVRKKTKATKAVKKKVAIKKKRVAKKKKIQVKKTARKKQSKKETKPPISKRSRKEDALYV